MAQLQPAAGPIRPTMISPLVLWPSVGAAVILAMSAGLAIWKAWPDCTDWLATNGATLIGATGGAAALFFIAAGAFAQARQTRSTEFLTAFELARPDLEGLSRRIATNARLVIEEHREGRPGRLERREAEFFGGDRTAFARMFGLGQLIASALDDPSKLTPRTRENLQRQVRLYILLFERVLALAPNRELKGFLVELPLGRAYCALKIAAGEDAGGRFKEFLERIQIDRDADVDTETEEPT